MYKNITNTFSIIGSYSLAIALQIFLYSEIQQKHVDSSVQVLHRTHVLNKYVITRKRHCAVAVSMHVDEKFISG